MHTARYISPVSVVLQCKLVSGWGNGDQRRRMGLVAREGLYFTYVACYRWNKKYSKLWKDIAGCKHAVTHLTSLQSIKARRYFCWFLRSLSRSIRCRLVAVLSYCCHAHSSTASSTFRKQVPVAMTTARYKPLCEIVFLSGNTNVINQVFSIFKNVNRKFQSF